MKGSVCVYLVFPFLLLCSLGSATLRILSNARLPSLQGEKLIRELNFFPKESINIVHPNDVSTAPITPRIVEKRFKFPNFADPDVSAEDLGHHAGYYTIQHSHAARETAQTGGTPGTQNNMELELLMNVFGGLGAGGLNLPNTLDVPPEELYVTQLSQLQEMGFFDTQENIRALRATSGNVHAAVERLLGNPGT